MHWVLVYKKEARWTHSDSHPRTHFSAMDFEAAWCPVCDKLIEPKRTTVPVNPPQPPAPAPSPASPQASREYPIA